MNYELWAGKKVRKNRMRDRNPKPFKSKLQVNTVRGLITHPQTGRPAFTFVEDDSYVECRVCDLVDTPDEPVQASL